MSKPLPLSPPSHAGKGTAPLDGMALLAAVVQQLMDRPVRALVVMHFHEVICAQRECVWKLIYVLRVYVCECNRFFTRTSSTWRSARASLPSRWTYMRSGERALLDNGRADRQIHVVIWTACMLRYVYSIRICGLFMTILEVQLLAYVMSVCVHFEQLPPERSRSLQIHNQCLSPGAPPACVPPRDLGR